MGIRSYRRRNAYNPRLDAIEKEVSRRVEIEYRSDIFKHLRELEQDCLPNAAMVESQPELRWDMRPELLEFLVEHHYVFNLKPETLFLAVDLIDRYCSTRIVYEKHYQLVGCTALWIAAKYDDKSRTPRLEELVKACLNEYTAEMFIQMELHVLNTLNWSITKPTLETYLNLCLGHNHNSQVAHVARYLCEMSLYPKIFIGVSPSVLAFSAFNLAMIITGHFPSVPSSISQQEVQCINWLSHYMKTPPRCLVRKYTKTSFGQATTLVYNYLARQEQQQQQVTFPPTPPPSASPASVCTPYHQASPCQASSASSSSANAQPVKNDLHIQVPRSFSKGGGSNKNKSQGFITPPCTPAEADAMSRNNANDTNASVDQPMKSHSTEDIAGAAAAAADYQSVPMETSRVFA